MEASPSPLTASVPQRIPINMWSTDDALVVVAAMPGVRAEDIAVLPHLGVLELRADLRTAASRRPYLVHEWDYGNYARMIRLPEGFAGPVTASFGNGQLAVRIGRGTVEADGSVDAVQVWDVGVSIDVHDAHDAAATARAHTGQSASEVA